MGFISFLLLCLPKVPVRTLALTGARDGCMDTRLWDVAMAPEDFPAGLEVRRVEGAGHFLHQEKPDEVNAAMVEWLSAMRAET